VAAYTQQDIDDLISCPKNFSEPPKKGMKMDGGHTRSDAKLVADNVNGEFLMFMRKNEDFPENFSIGITYHPADGRGEITLLRCNGKHGEYNGNFSLGDPHYDFHIHRATEEAIEKGLKAEKYAAKTFAYASFEEAVQYFVKAVNLSTVDANRHFPNITQHKLFD
jgi:hypothetical protein